MKDIIINNFRIQILAENLVRIEKKYKNSFEDENTFFIPNRTQYNNDIDYSLVEENEYTIILFSNYKLYIPNKGRYNQIKLTDNSDKVLYKLKKVENSGELPKVNDTPSVFALNDAPHIVLPEEGYTINSFKNNHEFKVCENEIDMYLFIVNRDHKLLRKMYVELTGRVDLVRMQTLGLWNSRYYKYRDEEVYALIDEYKKHKVPLDNFVIDTDWRKANDIGIGYEIDTDLFPNMKNVFNYAHKRNISIMFNDHPEPYEKRCNVFEYDEVKFREYNLTKLLEMGLDTWWYDRNWTTKLISPTKRIEPETFGLYLFNDITKKHYQRKEGKYHTRPDIMGNLNEVTNGRYERIKDSASHRYSIQWTGDNTCVEGSISLEVATLIRACENEITYTNFDVGGHSGNPDKELYLKWIKFASFTPVMRPHCTIRVKKYREPWNYDEETLDIAREYINIKYRLLSYVYSNAYKNYVDGEPLIKSLSYNYPNIKRLKDIKHTYMLGNNIMVSPDGGNVSELIDEKNYTSPVIATFYDGTELKGQPLTTKKLKTLNMALKHNSPFEEVPPFNFSATFETKLKFNEDVIFTVRNDDGARVYVNGELKLDDWNAHAVMENNVCLLKANEEYNIKIEYYQGGGEAALKLCYKPAVDPTRKVLMPGSNWIDPFNGKIYKENKQYTCESNIRTIPLFIKEGSLIPLLKAKKNTSLLKYDDMIFEYYPSKNIGDSGFIYEDDRRTIAYQDGMYRTTNYETYYDSNDNSCSIVVYPTIGKYVDDIKEREILFKYYLINNCSKVERVTINDEDVEFKVVKRNKKLYPFNEKEASSISQTLVFKKKLDINKKYIIKYYLK